MSIGPVGGNGDLPEPGSLAAQVRADADGASWLGEQDRASIVLTVALAARVDGGDYRAVGELRRMLISLGLTPYGRLRLDIERDEPDELDEFRAAQQARGNG